MNGPRITPPTQAPLLPVNHKADRPLRIVLTIMAFLAALSLLGSRMTERAYDSWQSELSDFATVQILPGPSGATADQNQADPTQTALTALSALDASVMSEASARDMLEPWLGDTPLPDGISLPVIIRVDGVDRAQIDAALAPLKMNYVVEDESRWQKEIAKTQTRIGFITGLVLILIISASLASTVFATQSAIAAERNTISVFTQVGASDAFIGTLFVKRALRLGGVAAGLGIVCAAVLAFILSLLGKGAETAFVPYLSLALSDGIALIVLALVLTGLGALAAGTTVRQILKDGRKVA